VEEEVEEVEGVEVEVEEEVEEEGEGGEGGEEEEEEEEEEVEEEEEEENEEMNSGTQPEVGGLGGIEDTIENLSQLGLDTPVRAVGTQPFKPGLFELWDTPKSISAPTSGNSTWISSCFFVGLGVNSVGRYEYTQMILPRRPGERVQHIATTSCDKCGTVVMYGRYNSPEVVPEHPRVSAYILRLETELVKPYVSIVHPIMTIATDTNIETWYSVR